MCSSERDRPVIVVVDDEVMIRNVVARILDRAGYEVLSAADGPEALELVRSYRDPISLVITDFNMPQMNGLILCEHILHEKPEIKLLVISGRTSQMSGNPRGLPFLKKPFPPRTLVEHVGLLLNAPPEL